MFCRASTVQGDEMQATFSFRSICVPAIYIDRVRDQMVAGHWLKVSSTTPISMCLHKPRLLFIGTVLRNALLRSKQTTSS